MERRKIKFFMPMEPPTATAQEKGINKKTGAIYLKSASKCAREKLTAYLFEHAPDEPLNGPIYIGVVWNFKTDDPKKAGMYRITKPDLDNLEKDLLDCMTHLGFWKDDAQIVSKHTFKKWTVGVPGIYIAVEELTAGGNDHDT